MESEFQKNTFPYLDLLYNFALRITGSEKNAEKLLLETYLRASRFYNHLDENTDYKLWMFRVIKKAYEDIYEKSENYEEVKTASEISDVLSSLPSELKTVGIISDIENFTDSEIVAFTDCPLPVIKERLKESRKLLFENLKKDSEGNSSDEEIQSFIKNLIAKKLKIEPTPELIRKKILKKTR